MTLAAALPPPILVGPRGSFAWDVFHRRHGVLVENLIEALPYAATQIEALRALVEESTRGVIEPLPDSAHDADRWLAWGGSLYYGKPWAETPFLWAESYFFRRVLDATGYFGDLSVTAQGRAAWRGVDPFAPMKDAELALTDSDGIFAAIAGAAGPDSNSDRTIDPDPDPDAERRFAALIEAGVLGNRADLAFRVTEKVANYAAVNPPLADDTAALYARLAAGPPAPVAVLCDNAGRELIADLLLCHHLLRTGLAARIDLHVKPAPYYLSDATASDVVKVLSLLRGVDGGRVDPDRADGESDQGSVGRELFEAAGDGRLRILTHPFWCSPLELRELPEELHKELTVGVVLVKGDLNYRRLVGDRLWDTGAVSFAEAVAPVGLPVAALRTVKSDVVVGVPAERVAQLDAEDPDWRINGTHTLIQTAF